MVPLEHCHGSGTCYQSNMLPLLLLLLWPLLLQVLVLVGSFACRVASWWISYHVLLLLWWGGLVAVDENVEDG